MWAAIPFQMEKGRKQFPWKIKKEKTFRIVYVLDLDPIPHMASQLVQAVQYLVQFLKVDASGASGNEGNASGSGLYGTSAQSSSTKRSIFL